MPEYICMRDCYGPTSRVDNGNRRHYPAGTRLSWQPCKHFVSLKEVQEEEAKPLSVDEMDSKQLKALCVEHGIDPGAKPTLKNMRLLLKKNGLE
jgi:hypothetical protein